MAKKRAIKFYTLLEKREDQDEMPANYIRELIEYISLLDKPDRVVNLTRQKFCFLDHIKEGKDRHALVIKSAKDAYRPNLVDRKTNERENPRRLDEGDGEKTHLVIKYASDDVYVIMEKNGKGVNINHLVKYLKKFTKVYMKSLKRKMDFALLHSIVPKDNFIKELKRLKRVSIGEIYVEKSILGSSALEYSHRTQNARKDIVIGIKAEPRMSIATMMEDVVNKMATKGSKISKVRVIGTNKQDGEVRLDTSFMEKIEHVDAEINKLTGEVNTTDILSLMREIADQL